MWGGGVLGLRSRSRSMRGFRTAGFAFGGGRGGGIGSRLMRGARGGGRDWAERWRWRLRFRGSVFIV